MGVTGIGGVFFRTDDPDALAARYKTHLGVGAGCDGTNSGIADEWSWLTRGAATTDYFPADKAFMLNLRVEGLDDLLSGLHAAGIEVETRAEWDSPAAGRFARIHDPERNPAELWEPPAGA